MWVPERFGLADDDAYALLAATGLADLLTPTAEGIAATHLPLVLHRDVAEHGVLRGHLARQNPHADVLRAHPDTPSLVIAHGPDAYVSPVWYASWPENPRTVPTWDYTVVHVHGRVRLVDDEAWLLEHLRALSEGVEPPRLACARSEGGGWSLDDAPADYVAGMVRAVVGLELVIERLEGKAKQSQNKAPEDVAGVVAGLRAAGENAAADEVARANADKQWPPLRTRYR